MASTFEVLATRCKQPLLSPAGLRLFGGRSARVTGATAYAARELDINKVGILARHSGDTILRYVGDWPFDNITSELAASSSQTPTTVPSRPFLDHQLRRLAELLTVQTTRLDALQDLVRSSAG